MILQLRPHESRDKDFNQPDPLPQGRDISKAKEEEKLALKQNKQVEKYESRIDPNEYQKKKLFPNRNPS